ncbi:hypothetical protein P7C70_g539, partial [Phenoliferia sp. Uapishka_3]
MVIKLNRSGGALYRTGCVSISRSRSLIAGHLLTLEPLPSLQTLMQPTTVLSATAGLWWTFQVGSARHIMLPLRTSAYYINSGSIRTETETTSKQQYIPSTNVLATKFLSDDGVGQIQDFMPLPSSKNGKFLPWLVRRVEVIRGTLPFHMECAPAFDYARAYHETVIEEDKRHNPRAIFTCPDHINLDLRYVTDCGTSGKHPDIAVDLLDLSARGHKGLGVAADFILTEGQSVTFILRELPTSAGYDKQNDLSNAPESDKLGSECLKTSDENPTISQAFIDSLLVDTTTYWLKWLSQCTYTGRWREFVQRSALAIKLLTFAPTGAIVAAPTFSLPEDLHGAGRNWDYRFGLPFPSDADTSADSPSPSRYSWLRDSSFSIYALLRLGFTAEADAYMGWLSGIMANKNEDGGLQIMYTIHGGKDIDEYELPHLDGHKGQKPVRVGNGAANHLQLDIYGELLDAIYLAQKLSKPYKVDDGTGGGEEGAFSMCTLWLIESLARAGEFDKTLLSKAVGMLEDYMGYSNHLDLLSEEISKGGEPLGNFPQAFSHVGLISTVFNVDRVTRMHR